MPLAGAERQRYNDLLVELHAQQRLGTNTQKALTTLGRQVADVSVRLDTARTVPADVKRSSTR